MQDDFVFGIGLKDNKTSNDFLRCLWSRLSATFGEMGWQYMPMRNGNQIFVGFASLGKSILLSVTLHYKQRGCLSKIDLSPSGYHDEREMRSLLKKCVEEALCSEKYLKKHYARGKLDKSISFMRKVRNNFSVSGNQIILRIDGFDDNDCQSMFKSQIQQVCNLMTFDTLRYITYSGTLMEEIRENHNYQIDMVDASRDEVKSSMEKNDGDRGTGHRLALRSVRDKN